MSVLLEEENKKKSVELEEVIGLSAEKFHALLIQCSWRLMDAYAVTGRELYFKQAEILRNIYSRMNPYIQPTATSALNHETALSTEE